MRNEPKEAMEIMAELKALEELRAQKIKMAGYRYYVPNVKQAKAHRSVAKKILFCGGNRSGKSTLGAVEIAWHLTGDYPEWFPEKRRVSRPLKLGIVSTDNSAIVKVIEPKLKKYFPLGLVPKGGWKRVSGGFLSRIITQNEDTIDILTNEQDDMAFEGQDWDIVWIDEPLQKRKFEAIERGLVDRGGFMIFTFTPLIEPWMKEDLVDKADGKEIDFVEVDIRDNKVTITGEEILKEENIQRFERSLPEDVRETRIHGKFFHLRGAVYKEFGEEHLIDRDYDPSDRLPVVAVLDPHDRQPHHVIWAYIDKTDDIFVDSEMSVACTIKELSACIRRHERNMKYRIKQRIIDPNFGRKPMLVSGRTVIQELAHAKCAGWTEGLDAKEEGRMKVKEFLHWDRRYKLDINNRPKLYFNKRRTPVTIRSIRNHQYDDWTGKLKGEKDPKEKTKDRDTHGADCVRYLCMSNPCYDRYRTHDRELEVAPY